MRVLLVSANREQFPSPVVPIGLLYVAAAARSEHEVRVLDLCFEDDWRAALAREISAHPPDVVGVSLRNLHDNSYGDSEPLLAYYEALGQHVRACTSAPIVLGGAAITLQPEGLLERMGATTAVAGEGERAFLDVLSTIAQGAPPPRVVRSAAASGVVTSLARGRGLGLAADLDALPGPARDLVDPRYYEIEGTDNVQTKRGCAFACTYCDYPDLEGKKVRARDPERVVAEMVARAKTPGVSHVFIVDSVFNVPRSHALAICAGLEREGAPIPWVAYVSPASLDDEVVAAMKRAGCVGAEIGTDTGSAASLRRLNKPFDLDDVRRVRASFVRHGVSDAHTFVLGAEGEGVREAEETFAFVSELDPDVAVFIVFMEDRETRAVGRSADREALLELLRVEAPKRPGWVVPELDVRFGQKVTRLVRARNLRGPSWVHLARARRSV
jgi:tRNA A37 methylthiotransferase MiaB